MADKNIQIKSVAGDLLYPKTKAGNVIAADGVSNLATVEPGAQVNKIEKIVYNGSEVTPVDGTVTLELNYDALHGKKCVEFTPQTLEEEQKAQARENIDAVSKLDLNTRLGGLTIIHNEDGSISITDGETEE